MTVTLTRPQRRRPTFHSLSVAEVTPLTDDAVAVAFRVPPELRDTFAFAAGQHLTVRRLDGGVDVRRSYSICSTPMELADRGLLRIGIKHLNAVTERPRGHGGHATKLSAAKDADSRARKYRRSFRRH